MNEKIKKLVKRIEQDSGAIRPWRQILAELDPYFMEIHSTKYDYVFDKRRALSRKVKEIIALCLDAATAFEPGFRMHVHKALGAGATLEELLEALEVVSFYNIHNLTETLPCLIEEVENYKKQVLKSKGKKLPPVERK